MKITPLALAITLICVLAVLAGTTAPAVASDAGGIVGGIFGALIGTVREGEARNDWQKVNREVKTCLSKRINVSIGQLVQKAIDPTDPRLRPYMQACEQQVAEANAQLQQERRIAGLRREQEEAAKEAAAVRNAHARAQKVARHRELIAKYGAKIASDIEARRVRIGMTKEATIAAIGKPNSREVVPPSNELWSYGTKRIAFTNGKVTYVGN
ncbi:MAG TPA: DUF4179 domain-containing protein [Gammaproteobacteria bacterium]|nr:DUF4179 domain-containing protein [Gammaproteobacteria bacterium]